MSSTSRVFQVILADDHPILLSGLRALVQSDPRFEVVAACSDGVEALETIRQKQPDLAVLDITMPGLTGLDVLAKLDTETRVIFLTASISDQNVVAAVNRGAWGILLKEAAGDRLLECLTSVAEGKRWLPVDLVTPALTREATRTAEVDRIRKALTARERELVLSASEGLSNKEIARRLSVTEGTVKIHLHNVYQKLSVNNRTALTALALSHRREFEP